MSKRLLMFHNTPKAKRYFQKLAAGLTDFDTVLSPASLRFGGVELESGRDTRIAHYSILRKRYRPHLQGWRLRANERLYAAAARWHYRHAYAEIQRRRPELVAVWGGNAVDVSACRTAARDLGVACAIFEIGLLPGMTTCDSAGVNAASSVPRSPSFYAAYDGRDARLPTALTARKSKRVFDHRAAIELPRRYLFVPFQVALDSQILLHSPWIENMPQLLAQMVDAVVTFNQTVAPAERVDLVFKRHPSCPRRYRDLMRQVAGIDGVSFADGNPTEELIRKSLAVVTINSSVGIEAMLYGKPVLTLGEAVYAIDGVADRARSIEALTHWLFCNLTTANAPIVEEAWPLREQFLRYLAKDYCLPGSHREPDQAHIEAVARRFDVWSDRPVIAYDTDRVAAAGLAPWGYS